jgi:hypothetical protein
MPVGLAIADPPTGLDCGYRSPAAWLAEIRSAVARGEIADPLDHEIPPIAPRPANAGPVDPTPCLTVDHFFLFEDTDQVLVSDFSDGELIAVLADAANALMAVHGDVYDFIGFFLNFYPDHYRAYYVTIFNDVTGIGDPSGKGTPIFDERKAFGVGGETVQGFVMMGNVNDPDWQPGNGPSADFTRLALGQEFEHRWALFLPDLLDGRTMQGDNASCGRIAHWNWKVDGQGSAMELSEWVGSDPAVLAGSFVTFNRDIPGGVFGYTDLYLMGYVSPAEMDAGNSELRYMHNSACGGNYFGPISDFTSADIIAAAGPRSPDTTSSQRDFNTGWVMIHLPGDPPTFPEKNKARNILLQHQIDWHDSTLGRGTMNNQLFPDCNCNGTPDGDDIDGGGSADDNGNGIPDECEPCPWDLDGSGDVGISDFLELLANWGAPFGIVDFLDLLAEWGPC